MTAINTEHHGGRPGSGRNRRIGGRFRRRIVISLAAVGAAVAALATPTVIFSNDPYVTNLQMIQGQTGRNTNHDGSAFRDVDQADLPTGTGGGLVDTNRAAYLGNPNGNPEQSFPVGGGGQFRTSCEFSHFAYDDPILFPRQAGKAHLHMFFGNTDVNAYSTYDTLTDSGGSTCNGGELNRTGYWSPAMIDGDGMVRIPERVVVYYKAEGTSRGKVQPYQPEMAMIASDPVSVPELATFNGGDTGQVNYKCTSNSSPFQFADGVGSIPNCDGDYYQDTFGAPYPATRTVLEMEVKFWPCFDDTGTPGDWNSWVPNGPTRGSWFYGNCDGQGGQGTGAPPLNDKEFYPHLAYFVNYVVEPGDDTSDWFLSSDVDGSTVGATNPTVATRGSTHHSDWWGGWHPDINQEFLDNCTNYTNAPTASGCGFGYLSDGGPNSGSPLPGRALTYRPQYDTVGNAADYRISLATLFAEICEPLGPTHTYTAGDNPARGAYCRP